MCIVKTPKVQASSATDNKPLPILRNPFLDGIDQSLNSLRIGRNQLRIDRTTNGPAVSVAPDPNALGANGVRIPTSAAGPAA